MRANRKIAGQNWEFDGQTITVHIPMTWKRRGGRKVIIAPDGGNAWAPAKPRPDETLIRALARAHRWRRLLEEGKYRSAGELAEAERRYAQLRQPLAAADAAGAGHRRVDFGWPPAQTTSAGGAHAADPDRVAGPETDLSPGNT